MNTISYPLSVCGLIVFLAHCACSQNVQNVPIVTVCQALSDRTQFDGKTIIVVGRLFSTDEGIWLRAQCDSPLTIDGHVWPSMMSLTYSRWDLESPPPEMPKQFAWNTDILRERFALLRESSKPGPPRERARWIAVYGRFETREALFFEGSDGIPRRYGFGHLNAAAAQLISASASCEWVRGGCRPASSSR